MSLIALGDLGTGFLEQTVNGGDTGLGRPLVERKCKWTETFLGLEIIIVFHPRRTVSLAIN